MKAISLTQGQVALVDNSDFEWLSKHGWYAHKTASGNFYATRHGPGPQYKTIKMHQDLLPGVPKVDHANRDTLDNRRRNLRPATHSTNIANSGRRRDNTSGYKGVGWRKDCGKWIARVRSNGHRRFLGYFSDAVEAAKAYDAEARKQFGEFACVNFP